MKMNFEIFLLLLSLVHVKGLLSRTRGYTEKDQKGDYYDFTGFIEDLSTVGFNDVIESVTQDGIWLYYDEPNYIAEFGMSIIWGVNASKNFDDPHSFSSLRFAGSGFDVYRSAWSVYRDDWFGGPEYYGETSLPSFTGFTVSSLIVVGDYPWTFFDQDNWAGNCFCVKPNTDEVFNLVWIPVLETLYQEVKSMEYGCRDGCSEYVASAQPRGTSGSIRYNGKL